MILVGVRKAFITVDVGENMNTYFPTFILLVSFLQILSFAYHCYEKGYVGPHTPVSCRESVDSRIMSPWVQSADVKQPTHLEAFRDYGSRVYILYRVGVDVGVGVNMDVAVTVDVDVGVGRGCEYGCVRRCMEPGLLVGHPIIRVSGWSVGFKDLGT